mmetsp:Transcript_48394/g.121836  ORF Transcript_48394/g.121836 Transcript_48394/m.121836 type:complete len:236 (+) Transcript_48394:390-1097(+)
MILQHLLHNVVLVVVFEVECEGDGALLRWLFIRPGFVGGFLGGVVRDRRVGDRERLVFQLGEKHVRVDVLPLHKFVFLVRGLRCHAHKALQVKNGRVLAPVLATLVPVLPAHPHLLEWDDLLLLALHAFHANTSGQVNVANHSHDVGHDVDVSPKGLRLSGAEQDDLLVAATQVSVLRERLLQMVKVPVLTLNLARHIKLGADKADNFPAFPVRLLDAGHDGALPALAWEGGWCH